jgi:hypothetical protein
VDVCLFEHSPEHGTPDAVFPNNWFSTHARGEADGGVKEDTLVYYPLKCPNRQAERRDDAMRLLEARLLGGGGGAGGGGGGRVVDLSPAERGEAPVLSGALAGVAGRRPPHDPEGAPRRGARFFEGTGVLVLDRVNGVAYVSVSERAHLELAHAWADSVSGEEEARRGGGGRMAGEGKEKRNPKGTFFFVFIFSGSKKTHRPPPPPPPPHTHFSLFPC